MFDWDGTLADSTDIIASVLQSACRELGHRVPDREAARHVIGLGLVDALRHAAPEVRPDQFTALAARYRDHYLARESNIVLFEGARDLLERLRSRYLLGVATGKNRIGLDRAMGQHALTATFHGTRCADEAAPKPDPAMLVDLMNRLQVRPAETLMIGDTTHDVEMGRRAGVRAIAISHGAHSKDKLALAEPFAIVDSLRELEELLAKM